MSMIKHCSQEPEYELTQREMISEEGAMYTAYGITCFQRDPNGTRYEAEILEDISCRKEMVEDMINIFNLCKLPADRFKPTVIALLP